jgi:type II secretory pathway component PulC
MLNYLLPSNAGDYKHADLYFVLNLLNAFGEEESFGFYRLKGVFMYATTPELSSANIEDLQTGQIGIYSLNKALRDGSELVDIKDNYVTLEKCGVRKKIYMSNGEGSQSVAVYEEIGSNGYKQIGDNEFVLKPYQIFQGDPNSILDFSVQASGKDGRMDGLKITNINENALVRNLGLIEGDVLLEVNKEPIHSLYKCIKICFDSKYSDEIQLKILRGEKVIFQIYHLYWEGSGSWTAMDLLNSKVGASLLSSEYASHLF